METSLKSYHNILSTINRNIFIIKKVHFIILIIYIITFIKAFIINDSILYVINFLAIIEMTAFILVSNSLNREKRHILQIIAKLIIEERRHD